MTTPYSSGPRFEIHGNENVGTIIGQQNIEHPLPAPPTWPLLVGAIPPLAPHYQHRTITTDLHQALATQHSVALRQHTPGTTTGSVLSGMGGVGKTQIAAAYTHHVLARSRIHTSNNTPDTHALATAGTEHQNQQAHQGEAAAADLVMWINASTRTSITDAYARQAPAILQRTFDTPDDAAHAFLNWLATTHKRWLIIFDDLVLLQPPHPDGTPVTLGDLWPPTTSNGRLLITTRDSGHELTQRAHTVLNLDVYTPDEADRFLTDALKNTGTEHTPKKRASLAELLGRLPLALSLAAAYLADHHGMTIADYADLFTGQSQSLERILPYQATGYERTIAATWALSIDHADQQQPRGLARPLAAIISLLDSTPIPLTVLTAPPTRTHLARTDTAISAGTDGGDDGLPPPAPADTEESNEGENQTPEQDVHDTLALLKRLNLITLTGNPYQDSAAVSMHQLVQRATREHSTTRPTLDRVHTIADALLHAWPEIERDTELGERLRAHTRALRTHTIAGRRIEEWLWQPQGHPVLSRAGRSLGESGQVKVAVHYWQEMARTTRHHLGPDHPDTLATRGNLARWLGEAGNPQAAATAYTELLTEMLRVLGPDHPHTLTTRNNLAAWLGQAGNPQAATDTFRELLTDQLRVLGPDHPDTLATRGNLAQMLGEAGSLQAATDAFRELLTDQLRVLGPDHPHTLATRAHFAGWLGEAGNPQAAATAHSELLTEMLRVLGPDHPDTLATRGNLAQMLGEAGNPQAAATAYAELLTDRLRVLGPDHPGTLATRGNLAQMLGEAGNPQAAATAYTELLTDRLRILGPDHPHTLTTRNNLAAWLGQAGNPQAATDTFRELLTDQLRV
ncbi:tetratricopeptide repeat protein, partial [Nocardiopsis lambiniae]